WHLLRALHVLLACLALWLPAAPSAPARFAADPAALVVTAGVVVAAAAAAPDTRRGAPEAASEVSVAARERIEPRATAPCPAPPATGTPPRAPNDAPQDPLYLLNCALLC
ncbi:MAG: hypothetical protein IT372_42755, partial [Polyangiaceae bacterium]|nr:hypothetical protein [Polyangiaceae bacterium]